MKLCGGYELWGLGGTVLCGSWTLQDKFTRPDRISPGQGFGDLGSVLLSKKCLCTSVYFLPYFF